MRFGGIVRKTSKLIPFCATAFPGGFKFLAVMLITNFTSAESAELFSEGFFWVLLMMTFSGVPVASMMSSRVEHFSLAQRYFAIAISTLLMFLVAYAAYMHKFSNIMLINVLGASFLVSVYEVVRKDYFNAQLFHEVFWCGVVSVFALLILVFFLTSFEDYFLLLSMLLMLLPLSSSQMMKLNDFVVQSNADHKLVAVRFLQYFSSNVFSSSIGALLPIVLLADLGSSFSTKMAQVVSVSKMLLLVPKSLAAKNIPRLRNEGPLQSIVQPYSSTVNIYFFFMAIISWVGMHVFYQADYLIYFLLMIGMQFSQLALPYSNVLSVEGRANELLQINFKGSLLFFVGFCAAYFFISDPAIRSATILLMFIGHHFVKSYLTWQEARPLII